MIRSRLKRRDRQHMTKRKPPRTAFKDWVDQAPDGDPSQRLPLTHITKALVAHDIIKAGRIEPADCQVFDAPLAYFFYGRPAYRLSSGTTVKLEASCPFCFLFNSKLLDRAKQIYPFDTGAFAARLYNHVLDEEFAVEDFSLGADPSRPEKLIAATYLAREAYVAGNRKQLRNIGLATKAYDLEARAYMELISSPGRNEPDDRIGTIEAHFGDPVPLANNLIAMVVPHTHWINGDRSPLLEKIHNEGVQILTYEFIPGRAMEHYHTLVEIVAKQYCVEKELI